MHLPGVRVILTITFLTSCALGTSWFAVYRWVAEKNPPAVSLQLGLITALGSLGYLLSCRLIPRMGNRLKGRKSTGLGLLIGIISFLLLAISEQVWTMYLIWPIFLFGWCLIGITKDYWLFMIGFALAGITLGHNYYVGVYYSLTSVSSDDATGQRTRVALNESYFA